MENTRNALSGEMGTENNDIESGNGVAFETKKKKNAEEKEKRFK